MNEEINITFDDNYRVRVLDPEIFTHTEELEKEASSFSSKLTNFSGMISTLIEILEGRAKTIEEEKLKAIGQSNRVENEIENRHRQEKLLQVMIKEKMGELDRGTRQLQSLQQVEAEQLALIEKLNNNEL